jgi:light-regulated signal transduction histidine kinase (bacteriophytochrome)
MLRQGQSADLARGLEIIERSGNNQRRLIEELLDVSQIETGDIIIAAGVVDLNDVVKHVADAAMPSIVDRNIQMTSSTSDGRTPVVGDEMRLQQIFGNLVANAIKFTSDGGRVTLSLTRTESEAEFEVADSGIGWMLMSWRGYLNRSGKPMDRCRHLGKAVGSVCRYRASSFNCTEAQSRPTVAVLAKEVGCSSACRSRLPHRLPHQ